MIYFYRDISLQFPMNDKSNELSVVIVTKDRKQEFERCLQSVKEKLPGAEVIVIELTERTGVAVARNRGIKKATKSLVMLLDDDAWVDNLPIEEIASYFNEHPDIGIIAPQILYPDGRIQESHRSFPTLAGLFWRGSGLYKIAPEVPWYKSYVNAPPQPRGEIDWAIGACLIIRRRVLEKLSYLDEKYFFGYEDADLCLRAKQIGYKTFFWESATIYHDYARSSAKVLSRLFWSHLYSIGRFYFKRAKIVA
jgi:N-acetylglucosaminyl-diphospho-decaprenol L-rhamnosyltransferase